MLSISRRCVPFTPFDKDLSTATVALVSATRVFAPANIVFPLDTLRELAAEGVIGRIVGRAGDRLFHKKVVRAALDMFTHDTPPGRVVTQVIR